VIEDLTKEEIARLSPDQQELIAKLTLQKFRDRSDLLKKAKGGHDKWIIPVLIFGGIYVFLYLKIDLLGMLPFIALGTWAVIRGIHRRIDAVLELATADQPVREKTGLEKI